jgi:hypothetical protein
MTTARKRSPKALAVKSTDGLFTLEVFITSGPVTAKFAKKNKIISRTIQIRGKQTLQDLHEAIFDAFDREEEHLYEFQVGGKGPMDEQARKYGPPMPMGPFSDETSADASAASLGSLGLKVDDAFGYWFDFGDDWWHQINVLGIDTKIPPGKYPKVAKRVGQSPPQYPDMDDEK